MNTKLQSQINTLESSYKKLFDQIKQYPDELLNRKPSPEKWSVIQVMRHLLESESASLKYLQKKTLDTSRSRPAGISGKGKLLLTQLLFIVPFKFKSPKMLDPADSFMPLSEIKNHWDKVRADTFQLLGKLPYKDLEKELWKHAIAGKMNIYQMLSFINIHFDRHAIQIERTLKQLQTKAAA